jgi:hypothetical protein
MNAQEVFGVIVRVFGLGCIGHGLRYVMSWLYVSVRLTTVRVIALLLGARFPAQWFFKHSVSVWDWDGKGPVAVVFAGLGALLCVVSAYSLLMSVLR